MAEKKKSLIEQRNADLEETMDYGGTAKVGQKEYEKDKEKKKGDLRSALLSIFQGKK